MLKMLWSLACSLVGSLPDVAWLFKRWATSRDREQKKKDVRRLVKDVATGDTTDIDAFIDGLPEDTSSSKSGSDNAG